MGLKYKIEYTNLTGAEFKAEISDVNYTGSVKQIRGTAMLEYSSVDKVLQSIRGSVLTLDLEASVDLSLTDLYSENETDITVDFFMDSQVIFKGFVKPDGIFTDFVNEVYTISLDCIDGLGTLNNLSFVDDSGLYFSGFMKEIDIIYNCLKRTSLDIPINVNIGIFHDGMTVPEESTLDVLNNTKLSANRFYKDDEKDNIMDCEEVLRSVLEKYCAIIHQHNGEWYIYRPQDLALDKASYFYRYVSGIYDTKKTSVPLLLNLGSQIDSYYPHHVNANQRININGSVSAFRANYKYGILKRFFTNPEMQIVGSAMDAWTIRSGYKFTALEASGGIKWDGDITFMDYEIKHDVVVVNSGDNLKLVLDYFSTGRHGDLLLELKLTNGTNTKYYTGTKTEGYSWEDSGKLIINNHSRFRICCDSGECADFDFGEGVLELTLNLAPIPFTGDLLLQVDGVDIETNNIPCPIDNPTPESYSYLKKIEIQTASLSNQKGEFHTVERVPKSSSLVENNVTIYNGDMISDVYEGVIKTLSNTNTSKWRHKGVVEEKKILQIMVEDTIKSRIAPQQVFIGDVFGFFSFLNVFNINNINGNFLPLHYRFDTLKNIVSLQLVEVPIFSTQILAYEESEEFGETIKPTIK